MNPASTPPVARLTKHLPLVEKIFLGTLVLGVILTLIDVNSSVMNFSLICLAITFFLYAYKPIEVLVQDNEQMGFAELFGVMILPKFTWISSAISVLGVAFFLIDFGNNGYIKLLMIGGLAIAASTVLMLFFYIADVKNIRLVAPILLRSFPLLFIDGYLLFK